MMMTIVTSIQRNASDFSISSSRVRAIVVKPKAIDSTRRLLRCKTADVAGGGRRGRPGYRTSFFRGFVSASLAFETVVRKENKKRPQGR